MTAGPARSACRRSAPTTAPQLEVDAEPSPDLLGSILSGQSLLMMNGADIVIHRDGSLSAKKAGEQLCPRPLAALRTPKLGATRPRGSLRVADPAALGFTSEQWVRALKVAFRHLLITQLVVGFPGSPLALLAAVQLLLCSHSPRNQRRALSTDLGPSGFQGGVGLAVEGRLGHTAAVSSNLGCCPLFKGPSGPRPFLTHR